MKGMIFKSAAVMWLAALSGTVYAGGETFELPTASGAYIRDSESFRLAANDKDVPVKKSVNAAPEVLQREFESPLITPGKVHQYLGLGTIALAGLTAVTAPEGCEHNCAANTPRETNGTHAKLAKATVAMAAATIATGLIGHWNDFHLEDGITDPDNLHVMLGVTGAALMAYAVNKSMHSSTEVSHAGIAEMGALGMAVAIKITW